MNERLRWCLFSVWGLVIGLSLAAMFACALRKPPAAVESYKAKWMCDWTAYDAKTHKPTAGVCVTDDGDSYVVNKRVAK